MKTLNDVLMILAVFILATMLLFGIAAAISGDNETTGQSIENG